MREDKSRLLGCGRGNKIKSCMGREKMHTMKTPPCPESWLLAISTSNHAKKDIGSHAEAVEQALSKPTPDVTTQSVAYTMASLV